MGHPSAPWGPVQQRNNMLPQVNRNGETWKGFDAKDLSMKEGCLFVCFVLFCFVCTYEIHCTRMLQIVFLVSLEKLLRRRGASGWFHGIWTCGVEVLEN